MCANYHAAANIQRGTVPLTDLQMVYPSTCRNDVDNRIYCANFVKVDLFDRNIVYLRLRVTK